MQNNMLGSSDDGSIIYQQLTSKYLDEAIEINQRTLFKSGNVSKTIGLSGDPEALNEMNQVSRTVAKDRVSIIAVDRSTNQLVGIAFNKIKIKSEEFYNQFRKTFKNQKSLQFIDYLITTNNMCNIFEHCQVDALMEHLFLGTLPEYRKKGIGKKLTELSIELAQKLCDGVNVKQSVDEATLSLEPVPEVVVATFTSFISQKIGERLGFEIAAERSNRRLEVLGKVIENPNCETPTMKLVYKKLERSKFI